MSTATVQMMTEYEITKEFEKVRKTLSLMTAVLRHARARSTKIERKRENAYQQLQKQLGKAEQMAQLPEEDVKRRRYLQRVRRYEYMLRYYSTEQGRVATHISQMATEVLAPGKRIEELEAMRGAYHVHISSQPSSPLHVTIRLLSGEVIGMETDRALPVAGWADQFVVQQGYQSSATARLVFLLQGNEEEKEENIVFWSPEERHHGQSIGDVLGDREPLLHLLIRSAGEEEQKEKAPLLRKILQTLHRDDSLSDKELYEMYANWRLTRDVSALGNRYQKMVAFVEAHPEDFPLLGEEEQARQTRRADLAAFRAFRSWAIPRRPEPDRKQAIRMRIAHTFQRHGQENANFNKIDMCRILCSLTVEEFFQTGAQIHNVRETFKGRRFLAEWERYCREADAENHEDA